MLNIHGIIRRLSLLLMFVSIGMPAAAADIQWGPLVVKGGLTIMQPSIDSDALIDEMALLRGALMLDKKRLSSTVEAKRFTGKDTVLAALLPGGLLYAAYKKKAHANALQEVAQVSAQLGEITSELLAFTRIDGPVVLAQGRSAHSAQ